MRFAVSVPQKMYTTAWQVIPQCSLVVSTEGFHCEYQSCRLLYNIDIYLQNTRRKKTHGRNSDLYAGCNISIILLGGSKQIPGYYVD